MIIRNIQAIPGGYTLEIGGHPSIMLGFSLEFIIKVASWHGHTIET